MALTITVNQRGVIGNLRYVVADVDFDTSYPTNGESLTPGDLGMDTVHLLTASPKDGLTFEYDYTNEALLAFEQGITTGSSVAADSTSGTLVEDFAAAETTFRAMGVAVDTTVSMGGLKEVANTTDLSSVTDVRIMAWGV